ncbi:hypothetical protein [Chlorogloeopsis fritschii]
MSVCIHVEVRSRSGDCSITSINRTTKSAIAEKSPSDFFWG